MTPTVPPSTPTQAEFEARLIGQKLALGRARKSLGDKIADGADPALVAEARAAVAAIENRISEIELGIEIFKQRTVDAKDSRTKESARLHEAAFLQAKLELRAAAAGIGQLIPTIEAAGKRLSTAANAVIVFGDPTTSYLATKLISSLRVYVGQALKQLPGFNTGLDPWLKLEQNRFEDIFPDPTTTPQPPKKAA